MTDTLLPSRFSSNIDMHTFNDVDEAVRKGIRGLPKHRALMSALAEKYNNTRMRDTV